MRQNNDNVGASIARRASLVYMIFAVIFALATIIYAALYVLADPTVLSYDSLYYMINDFNISVTSTSENSEYLSYNGGEEASFGEYRGGLAVLSDTTLTVFSAKGKRTLDVKHGMTNPRMRLSKDCIVVYAQNGKNVSVYNSFSAIHTENDLEGLKELSTYSIVDVAVTSGKSFAVAVNVGTLDFRVYLYGENGKLKSEYRYSDLVTSVSLNESGSKIGITYISSTTADGDLVSGTLVYDTSKSETLARDVQKGTYPISASFAGENLFSVYSGCVSVYNSDLMLFTTRAIGSENVMLYAKANEYGCLCVCGDIKTGEKNRVFAFDKMCDMVYNITAEPGHPILGEYSLSSDILLCREGGEVRAIVLGSGRISHFDLESEKIKADTIILERTDDTCRAVICYQSKGKNINLIFEDNR